VGCSLAAATIGVLSFWQVNRRQAGDACYDFGLPADDTPSSVRRRPQARSRAPLNLLRRWATLPVRAAGREAVPPCRLGGGTAPDGGSRWRPAPTRLR
jgi:hypothetical protein